MFSKWSIKGLLQLWSFATIIAIVVIVLVALYANDLSSETQSDLTNNVLPMESASRKISAILVPFVTRQKQVIASKSVEDINKLTPRWQLDVAFSRFGQEMSVLVKKNELGTKIVESLKEYNKRFLETDSEIFSLIIQQHTLNTELQQQTERVESLEQNIQNKVEAISGIINLQSSRKKRAVRELSRLSALGTGITIENDWNSEQDIIQKLSQSVRLNTLKINYLTQKLLQTNSIDNLLNIKENDIRQYESTLKNDITLLKVKLQSKDELRQKIVSLEHDVLSLINIVLNGDSAIYPLRLQQLQNEKLLAEGQQRSISILKVITTKLEKISKLVSKQSVLAVEKSVEVVETAFYLNIILGLFIILGMLQFINVIPRRINFSLTELRSAMHALSSEEFDTRLKEREGKSEFALLATDFNLFAKNTQNIIGDLATAKNAIQIRERHISAILNGVPEAILTLSSSGVIQSINIVAEQVLKAKAETLIGLNLIRFFAEHQNIESVQNLENSLKLSKEFDGLDYNNQPFSMWLSLNRVSNDNDDVWVCVISDITAWKQVEEELKTTSSELDAILENAMVGIALIKDRVIIRVNNKFEQLFACEREEFEGLSTRVLYPSETIYNQIGDDIYGALEDGGDYVGEVQLVQQNGKPFWGAVSCKALDDADPIAASIWLFEDITLQREKDEKLLNLASFDSLTGLPNRNVFNDRLTHALKQANRGETRLAIFFLDLDHFKNINDSLGHKAGDILLCEVASRLEKCMREGDTVARLGGDEFTVILEDIRSAEYVAKVAEKVLTAISRLYLLDNTEVRISPSIGISLYPTDGENIDALLMNADAAMYHAKNSGRNNFQFYSAEMNAQAAKRLEMETSLRRAVENNEFYLHFQPQIDLSTGRISGAEALLRWDSEQWGSVSPMEFVPILEETGLIVEVGNDIIRQATQAYMSLKNKVDPDFQIAVNLSARQFQGGQLAAFVLQQLEESGMPASNLELEITETVLMDDTERVMRTLNSLSELGITLAIDDFGTGYSSFSYLKRFPLDVLKIDREFVRDITVDADDAAIVDAILAMSRRLQLTVVAEGVETRGQLEFLRAHGCERVQGYLLSKPLNFDEFVAFIEQENIQSLTA